MTAGDIWGFFDDRCRECRELGLSEDDFDFLAEEGSTDLRGQIAAAIGLTDRAWISVHEVVAVQVGGHVHREEYAYFLVIDGREVWGLERDPTHDPAEHGHFGGTAHVRDPDAGSVTFKEAVELAWETVSREAEFGMDELDPPWWD